MSKVLRHPAADAAPVCNPRRRGPLPSNVTRLQAPAAPPPSKQPAYQPALVNVLVDGGVGRRTISLGDPADDFEMLLNLIIAMCELVQHMEKNGVGSAQ